VHVVEFFDSLFQTPHVKVVKSALPKARQRIVATGKDQIQLPCGRSPLATQAARDALFQNLNDSGRRSFGRLADEQMDVLRHDDITHQGEAVAVAHLAKNMDENISGANRTQKRQASIAGERNEMQMTVSIAPNEFVGHETEEKSKPRPFKTERVGHPEKQNQILGVDVLEWYHPIVRIRQQENTRKGVPPAQQKLQNYANDPYANDNKGFLGKGRDFDIIAGRVKSLIRQINDLRKQLEECERKNGLR